MTVLAARYELLELLGRGSSSVVHRARDLTLDREVAVKIIQSELTPELRARILREAQVAARFRHSGACEIFEVGEAERGPFIVMELVAGVALDGVLAAAPIPLEATVEIGRRLVDVLVGADAIGLVHRDLKPANILVDGPLANPTRVCVIDFGLAFLVAPQLETLGRLTQDSAIIGTPAYMAPEQIDGRDLTPAADVYALGCVLYELATRRTPFLGGVNKILAGHLYLPPIPPSEIEPAIGPALDRLIVQMLAKAPADRPAPGEIALALEAIARGGDRHPRTTTGQTRAERSAATPVGAAASPGHAEVRIGLLSEDAALHATLAARGVAIAAADPEVLLVTVATPLAPCPALPVPIVGLVDRITPRLLTQAIQAGYAAILGWPLETPVLLGRLGRVRDEFRLSSK